MNSALALAVLISVRILHIFQWPNDLTWDILIPEFTVRRYTSISNLCIHFLRTPTGYAESPYCASPPDALVFIDFPIKQPP